MGFLFLEKWVIWCFVILRILVAGIKVHGSLEGSISLDCGIPDNYVYKDNTTGIDYISDYKFIGTGTNYSIASIYIISALPKQVLTVRSFPEGRRNCYTLEPAVQDNKYLLRATFMYGNYDNKDSVQPGNPVQFDLHIGVNLWKTVNISDASLTYTVEAITVALGNFISVCLINTDHGTPFISSLEMRELKSQMYSLANASQSLVLFQRFNMGIKTNQIIRYPDDPYDRVWLPLREDPLWTEISTNLTVANYKNDEFEGPSAVLQTAAMQANLVNSTSIAFSWDAVDVTDEYFSVFYFSELEALGRNGVRMFSVNYSGSLWFEPFSPQYLLSFGMYPLGFFTGQPRYNFSLHATDNSTRPPLMNAREIYTRMQLQEVMTDRLDVDAIMEIKGRYQLKKKWMGDPCKPHNYAWDNLQCNYSANPPRITAINLSSSGLVGEISSSFSKLQTLSYLDLSYNSLTGAIPEILANILSLQVLNLTGNNFTGDIPDALKRKANSGALILRIEDNANLCANGNSCQLQSKKKSSKIAVIVIVPVVVVVLSVLMILVLCILKKRKAKGISVRPQNERYSATPNNDRDSSLQLENRQFTYREVEIITNSFQREIGKGGFGAVYDGFLDNGTQVAVKTRSQSSLQGVKEFLAEVINSNQPRLISVDQAQHLTRVHHKNLVSMIGYCKDGDNLALVYEYMSEGTLQEQLRGRGHTATPLTWRQRLRIALGSAQGLEYLHKGCKPPLIHRDVKPNNILLNANLEAKIADFGLSKAYNGDTSSHVSTAVVGTPGYLDPEYYRTFQLSEKSDVFSFGVVLLEVITAQPAIIGSSETIHIVPWVRQRLARGIIESIIDPKLAGEFDVNSVWKVADVALKCTSDSSSQRPNMTDVVMQLKECLELEEAGERSHNLYSGSSNPYSSSDYPYTKSSDFSHSASGMEQLGGISMTTGPAAR